MIDEYAGLSSTERRRLEQFAIEFEDVDPAYYEQYAGTTTSTEEIEVVRDVANRVLGSGARRTATKKAIRAFMEAADLAIRRRWRAINLLFGSASFPSRTEDRARLLESLERAVVAVILWDDLSGEERAALVGPWSMVVERALAAG